MSWLTAKQYGIIGLVSIISVWLPLWLSSSAFLGAFSILTVNRGYAVSVASFCGTVY